MSEKRTPRKKGQKRKSSKHSDLYTDEDPKDTIHGLGFKDATTARQGVAKVNKSGRDHAHKVQATLVMKQRAKVAKGRTKDPEKKKNITAAYEVWSDHLEKLKKKTKSMKESLDEFVREVLAENVSCRVCGDPTDGSSDTCELHMNEPTQLELLGADVNFEFPQGKTIPSRPYRNSGGRPTMKSWGLS